MSSPGIASADCLWCTARAPWLFRDSQKLNLLGQLSHLASYDLDGLTHWMLPRCVFKGQLETKWTSFLQGCVSTARFSSCLPCFSPLLTPSFKAQERSEDAKENGTIPKGTTIFHMNSGRENLFFCGEEKKNKLLLSPFGRSHAFWGKWKKKTMRMTALTNTWHWHWEAPPTSKSVY